MKKLAIVIGIGLTFLMLGWMFLTRPSISVHDLDWSDYEGMNDHVSEMTFNIPPHFMGEIIEVHFDLTDIFRLFSDNQDLLRDQPEVSGRTLESDFEVVIEFIKLTGNEEFLNSQWSHDTLRISFYVDRSLAQESLDLISVVESAYHRALNPSWFPETIPIEDINWQNFIEDYASHIEEIWVSRFYWRFQSETFVFRSDENDLTSILGFFDSNNSSFVDGAVDFESFLNDYWETGSYEELTEYTVLVIFHRQNDEEPYMRANFHMSQELGEQFIEAVGEEVWERAQR